MVPEAVPWAVSATPAALCNVATCSSAEAVKHQKLLLQYGLSVSSKYVTISKAFS